MIFTKKVSLNSEPTDEGFFLYCEGLKLKTTKEKPVINLKISVGEISCEKEKNEQVVSILDKIEKYQKGKMSEKEAGKMANKIKEMPELIPLVDKISKMEVFDENDLNLLKQSVERKIYKVIPDKMNILEEDFVVLEFDINKLISNEELNQQLESLYKEQQSEKIRQIMGTADSSRRTVVDYLKEKQQQIINNAPCEYKIDLQSPMPQANDLKRVLEWGQMVANSGSDKIDLEVLENDSDKRDVSYYASALCFLGLVYMDNRSLCLTYAGEKFFKQDEASRKAILLDILCQDDMITRLFGNEITQEELKKEFGTRGINGTTVDRRVSCLKAWQSFLFN